MTVGRTYMYMFCLCFLTPTLNSPTERINILSYGIKSGPIFLPFCQGSRVWRTDRRTDRRTDGRTDRILLAIPRLHYMQRG